MPNQLTDYTGGNTLAAADLDFDNDLIEDSFDAVGPYVVTGLVPSAGTGLSVNVTAGTALIGMLVTAAAGFVIGSLDASTTNHLYVLSDGTGAHNTTGTAPADSVKIGTALTDGTGVLSVDTSSLSGRQSKPTIFVAARILTLVTITPASDADVTLTNAQAESQWLTLVAGSWTAGHNLILPATAGLGWWLTNNSGFSAVPKTLAGTGPTIATGKTAMVAADGTNVVRMTTDA